MAQELVLTSSDDMDDTVSSYVQEEETSNCDGEPPESKKKVCKEAPGGGTIKIKEEKVREPSADATQTARLQDSKKKLQASCKAAQWPTADRPEKPMEDGSIGDRKTCWWCGYQARVPAYLKAHLKSKGRKPHKKGKSAGVPRVQPKPVMAKPDKPAPDGSYGDKKTCWWCGYRARVPIHLKTHLQRRGRIPHEIGINAGVPRDQPKPGSVTARKTPKRTTPKRSTPKRRTKRRLSSGSPSVETRKKVKNAEALTPKSVKAEPKKRTTPFSLAKSSRAVKKLGDKGT